MVANFTFYLLSKQHVNPQEEKLPGSSWLPRLPVRAPQPPEELRSPIVTGHELWLFVKFVVIKNLLNFLSGNSHSRGLFVKSPKTSKLTFVSKVLPLWHCKKQVKLTWLVSLKIPTCVLFMPNVWPLCQRISNWLAEFAERGLKYLIAFSWGG